MLQILEGPVGGDDQRLSAPISAVDHVVDLLQFILSAALHADVIQDKQRGAAEVGDVLIPALVAGGQVFSIKAKFVMWTATSCSIRALVMQPAK